MADDEVGHSACVHAGGVEADGVVGYAERRHLPAAIEAVAFRHVLGDGSDGGIFSGGSALGGAPLGSHLGTGIEEEFIWSLRKDDGPDVAPFHDEIAA